MGFKEDIFARRGELAAERGERAAEERARQLEQQRRADEAAQYKRDAQAKGREIVGLLQEHDVPVSNLVKITSIRAVGSTTEHISTGWPIMIAKGPGVQDVPYIRRLIGITEYGRLFTGDTHIRRVGRDIDARMMDEPKVELGAMALRGFQMGVLSVIEHGDVYRDESDDFYYLYVS